MQKTLFTFFVFLLGFASVQAQQKVTGKVLDETGSGLPGVSITLIGSTTGTNTDNDGYFSINAAPNSVLSFSFIGYEPQEVKVGNKSVINVSMEQSSAILDEVIVTTFGTAKKESFTGSAGQISSKQIADRPITNLGSAIAGTTAGVIATAGSGQPGSAPDIRIRGFGSVTGSSNPLYIVDGIPYSGDISNINPDDIETITILKDAASTALYGARAANGIVNVTTKKGKNGQSRINVKFTNGQNSRGLQEYDRVDASQYYPLMWEQYRNSIAYRATNPIALPTANLDATNRLVSLVGYNVFNVPDNQLVSTDGVFNPSAQLLYSPDDMDWAKALMRQGNRNEVNINFTGGQDKSDYFLSFSYLKDKGFIIRSDFERYTARLSYNSQVKSWLKAGTNISMNVTNSQIADADGNTSFVNPFFFSRGIGPIYPIYAYDPANPGQFLTLDDGSRRFDYGNLNALGLPNRPQYGGRHAVAETMLNQNNLRRNVVSGRSFIEIPFLKDFKFTSTFGVDVTNLNNSTFGNKEIGDAAPAGRATHDFSNIFGYNFNQLLEYNKTIGKNSFNVLVGHENYDYRSNFLTGSRSAQILDGNIELINFTTTTNLNSGLNRYRVEGYFSRFNYDFDNKYFFSGSLRQDASSKFFTDNRTGVFYAVSGAWRIDQEDFMKEISFISNLKVRGSYGEVGNDGGVDGGDFYAWQPLYGLGNNNASEAGILQSSLGNRDLVWESSNSYDAALEFGLFNNRINGTVEYFNRQSSNLIFDVPLPLSAGIGSQIRNIGTMYNRGIELELNGDIVRTKDFTWNLSANATKLKNKITKLPAESQEIINGTKRLIEGSSLYDYWLREYTGVRQETGEVTYRAVTFNPANSFITASGDTLTTNVNNARFHYNGSAIPNLQGGFTNSFKYKSLTLSALIVYQLGGKVYDGAYSALMTSGGTYGRGLSTDILNRWQQPGDITDVPRLDAGRSGDFDAASDRWLIDGSYANIRTITLSYGLPRTIANRLKLENAQFYVSGENFFIFSNRKGMNVQQNFAGTTTNAFSLTKSFVTGVSFSL